MPRKAGASRVPDTIIAAVAIHNGPALIADNAKDFPMPELSIHSLPVE
jgi:predicted nucleic acid-binding protein